MARFEDKDVALFLLKWGTDVRVLIALLLLFAFLVYVNIKLWRRNRANREAMTIDWTQDLDCAEVDVPLPPGRTSRDVTCKIMPTTIYFAFKGEAPMIEVRRAS